MEGEVNTWTSQDKEGAEGAHLHRGKIGVKLSGTADHQARGAILKGGQDEERGPSSMAQFTRHRQCQYGRTEKKITVMSPREAVSITGR